MLLAANWVSAAPALTPDMQRLLEEIQAQKRLPRFAFMREFTPYGGQHTFNVIHHEFHRVFWEFDPPAGSFEAQILQDLNDPQNKMLVTLRRYIATLRAQAHPLKDPSDPYTKYEPDETIYLLISNLNGMTGPMTQINVANLILPSSWSTRSPLDARPEDGHIVYSYFLMADGIQRTLRDLFKDRQLFHHFIVHLGLRLVEAETRGVKRGLQAHLKAHTGPDINLGYGTTWCENRGFYESWALAHSELLTQMFPAIFPALKPEQVPELDRFLIYSDDPWHADWQPLKIEAQSWNTPQGPLRSNFVNAVFQVRLWRNPDIREPLRKSLEVLARKGSNNLREFYRDWENLFPEDRAALKAVLSDVTHGLAVKDDQAFQCTGDDLWISLFPRYNRNHQMNFNASRPDEMQEALTRLVQREAYPVQLAWLYAKDEKDVRHNLVYELADAIIAERAKRCGQFKDSKEILTFIFQFGRAHHVPLMKNLRFVKAVAAARYENLQIYKEEREKLLHLGGPLGK